MQRLRTSFFGFGILGWYPSPSHRIVGLRKSVSHYPIHFLLEKVFETLLKEVNKFLLLVWRKTCHHLIGENQLPFRL